jgi:hypothetical protein
MLVEPTIVVVLVVSAAAFLGKMLVLGVLGVYLIREYKKHQ